MAVGTVEKVVSSFTVSVEKVSRLAVEVVNDSLSWQAVSTPIAIAMPKKQLSRSRSG